MEAVWEGVRDVLADNIEFRNIKSINVSSSEKVIFCLLYDKKRSLIKRIKLEQIRTNKLKTI